MKQHQKLQALRLLTSHQIRHLKIIPIKLQTAKFLLFIIPQQAVQKLLHKQLQIPQMQTFLKSLRLIHIQAMTSTGLMITAV